MFDLIYLDPPFNSDANYSMIFKSKDGKASKAQIVAFKDTWEWTEESEATMKHLKNTEIGDVMIGLEKVVGHNDMFAYVVSMSVRLLELHRVLKESGSIFLHCDPTASHYLKIIMDSIFSPINFKNEISWKRSTSDQKGNQYEPKKFGCNHDVILFYVKNHKKFEFDPPKKLLTKEECDKKFKNTDPDGRRWLNNSAHIWRSPGMGSRPNLCYEWKGFKNQHSAGWRFKKAFLEAEYKKGNFEIIKKPDGTKKLIRKIYEEDYKGENIGDFWEDILPAQGKERVGFPTQKPEKLLKRIIEATTNPGDLVLDPFCGCGTTVMESENLQRRWVGIDITHLSINEIIKRIKVAYNKKIKIHGIPKSFDDAKMLAEQDKFEFQKWAVSMIPNAYPNKQLVGDGGIDGKGQIQAVGLDGKEKDESIVISVKGGKNVGLAMLRELVGTMKSNKVTFGVFICLEKPSKNFYKTAAECGTYSTPYGEYPKCQIFTVEDYFEDKLPKIIPLSDTNLGTSRERHRTDSQTKL